MLPVDARARLDVRNKQGIAIYRQGRQDLVLRLGYQLSPLQAGEEPVVPQLAWVVPTPSVPESYGRVEAEVFDESAALWPQPAHGFSGGFGGGPSDRGGLELLPVVVEGEYTIQPLRAHGVEGAQALQQWLGQNRFEALPPGPLAYYVRNKWTFLAIRVSSRGALARSGTLPALRVSFRSDRIWFPMKLARGGGPLPAQLYVFTDQPLPDAVRHPGAFGFRLYGRPRRVTRQQVGKALGGLWDASALADVPLAFAYQYKAAGVRPGRWRDEFSLPAPH